MVQNPTNVHYLCFEGGGGKGSVYCGALMALEKLGILPITTAFQDPKGSLDNQIKGISGASAGSITAFLVALGYTGAESFKVIMRGELLKLLEELPSGESRVARITHDAPPAYEYTSIENQKYAKTLALFAFLSKSLSTVLKTVYFGPLAGAQELLEPWDEDYDKVLKQMVDAGAEDLHDLAKLGRDDGKHLTELLVSLLTDRGLLPGLKIRDVFSDLMVRKIKAAGYADRWIASREGDLASFAATATYSRDDHLKRLALTTTFDQFFELTGVDLIIAATNLSTGRPEYFSKDTTPWFSVIEAVGLSMTFPIVFKPGLVEVGELYEKLIASRLNDARMNLPPAEYERLRSQLEGLSDLNGWYADGGIANNLPMHAFNNHHDERARTLPPFARRAAKLNERMLALKIDDPPTPRPKIPSTTDHVSMLFNAIMWSTTDGQIRTEEEARQVITLYNYDETEKKSVDLFDFRPPIKILLPIAEKAATSVLQHFQCEALAVEVHRKLNEAWIELSWEGFGNFLRK